jgi:hypothetical protein
MFTVTSRARKRLLQKLAKKAVADDVALRFTRRERGWLLGCDQKRLNDITFDHEGREVLLMDSTVLRRMSGMTLSVKNTESGPRLRLRKSTKE